MTYQTNILTEDITLTGPLTADLFISTTGTDADFIVKVVDVFPPDTESVNSENTYPLGGYQMLVRGEVFRGQVSNSLKNRNHLYPEGNRG
jgi:predicted acyl esterase